MTWEASGLDTGRRHLWCRKGDCDAVTWEASGQGTGRWHVFCRKDGCDAEVWSCDGLGASPSHCLRAQGWQKATHSRHQYCPRHAWDWQAPDTELLWCEHRHPYLERCESMEPIGTSPTPALSAQPPLESNSGIVASTADEVSQGASSPEGDPNLQRRSRKKGANKMVDMGSGCSTLVGTCQKLCTFIWRGG